MDIEHFMQAAALGLGICGLALVIASWLKRNKHAEDWAMALGATCAMFGAFGLIMAVMRVHQVQSDEAGFMIMGLGVTGVLVFTMGFVIDRIKDRQKKDHNDYMQHTMGGK